MHGAEGIVEIGRHDPFGGDVAAEELFQQGSDDRNRMVRIGDLPAHHHHQTKAEEEEKEGGDAVLDADDFMIGGKDVLPEKIGLGVFGLVQAVQMSGMR